VSRTSAKWRPEAAELSLAIAREIQARNAEGNYYSGKHDRRICRRRSVSYALNWPSGATSRPISAPGWRKFIKKEPRSAASAGGIVVRPPDRHQDSLLAKRMAALNLPRGRRRPPWPDGPRARVDMEFTEACLAGDAFSALVRADPAVALEVLLAVSIEDPKEDDIFSQRSMDECNLTHWREGNPPMYFRGSFLSFLRTSLHPQTFRAGAGRTAELPLGQFCSLAAARWRYGTVGTNEVGANQAG
jgi:hypothetical protein